MAAKFRGRSARRRVTCCGTDPGSKYDKAKELGVAILTEAEFEKDVGPSIKWSQVLLVWYIVLKCIEDREAIHAQRTH